MHGNAGRQERGRAFSCARRRAQRAARRRIRHESRSGTGRACRAAAVQRTGDHAHRHQIRAGCRSAALTISTGCAAFARWNARWRATLHSRAPCPVPSDSCIGADGAASPMAPGRVRASRCSRLRRGCQPPAAAVGANDASRRESSDARGVRCQRRASRGTRRRRSRPRHAGGRCARRSCRQRGEFERGRVLTGITTTGTPHLGNYVGAIRPAIAASRAAGVRVLLLPGRLPRADQVPGPDRVQKSSLEIAATWLALGLDTERATASTARATCPRFPSSPGC
jgi:hypothetical protein